MSSSIFSWLEHAFTVTEQDVVAIVLKAKKDIVLVAHEIDAALGWIANNTPQIAADITQVATILQAVPAIVPTAAPEVEAAVVAANVAVAGLNKFAAAYKSGSGDALSVIAGYSAIKSAQSAVAKATALAVAAPVVVPAPSTADTVPASASPAAA
jgi:hypothetical protein